ncbi:MAG: tRNA lysidine(34) synthetase TilS [Bacteroidota bacterium]
MLQNFKSFIDEQKLFEPVDRVLLAVSGGLDSVVMVDLFHHAGYPFGIAHANFQLRGEESEGDERFVETLARHFSVPFFTTRFPTSDFADVRKISIQMAARELRYEWFETIRRKEGFYWIATAHHLDDQAETFFINLFRGTGISGLHGIPARQGKVIRPLLFATREDILRFSRKHQLSFREDSSNSSHKYTRNKIRHQLFPLLHSIEPNYAKQITATIRRVQETESILKPLIEKCRKSLIRPVKDHWTIQLVELRKLSPLSAWLYELLTPFEFNEATIRDLIRSLDLESGKAFLSPTYRIIKDRNQLIITKIPSAEQPASTEEYLVDEATKQVTKPIRLSIQSFTRESGYQISADKNRATLDKKKLSFPLILRRWQPGDYFYPLGMNNRKKLSDFFIDEKIPIPGKEECWLLCSGNRIVWVIGHRIDHRYRVSTRSRELLVVDFLPR